jgi:hypothetical protein
MSQKKWSIDEEIEPRRIIEVHSVRDKTKLARLTEIMKAKGWYGRPLLVWDTGNGVFALTGSHRIAAAKSAGVLVPVMYVNSGKMERYAEKSGETVDTIVGAGDDRVEAILKDAGDKRALRLMQAESSQTQENPAPNARSLAQAKRLYKGFTGRSPRTLKQLAIPALPATGLAIGRVFGIMYDVAATGERFQHEFKGKSRPLLVVADDGKQVFLIGGSYTFTQRGFVDRK